jgi:hypothetical protein
MGQDRNSNSDRGQLSPAGRGEIEATVAAIWKELLGLPQIGINDNFFDVGGTSLLATILLKRLNITFKCGLQIADVFECRVGNGFVREFGVAAEFKGDTLLCRRNHWYDRPVSRCRNGRGILEKSMQRR